MMTDAEIEKLKEENARLREALSKYANRANWENSTFGLCWKDKWGNLQITRNGYEIARDALK